MLVCVCVFVHVNVCGWGIGRTSGLFSLPLSLSLSASVGLWFEQCRSNATPWHPLEKTGLLPRNTDWTLTECLIWQRRWRLSNHRKKEIRAVLYSPTTSAHATRNYEKQNNTKSLGEIWMCFFNMLYTCSCNLSVQIIFLYYSFSPHHIRQAGRSPCSNKTQIFPSNTPSSHRLALTMKQLLSFHIAEIITHIIEHIAIEIYPKFNRNNT